MSSAKLGIPTDLWTLKKIFSRMDGTATVNMMKMMNIHLPGFLIYFSLVIHFTSTFWRSPVH